MGSDDAGSSEALAEVIPAAAPGRPVYYRSLRDLARAASAGGTQAQLRLRVLAPPALLVADEIACLPVSPNRAPLCFRLISARSERTATGLTYNKGLDKWEAIRADEVLAAAVLDRLLHRCHLAKIRGNSYRMRQRGDLAPPLRQVPARKTPGPGPVTQAETPRV